MRLRSVLVVDLLEDRDLLQHWYNWLTIVVWILFGNILYAQYVVDPCFELFDESFQLILLDTGHFLEAHFLLVHSPFEELDFLQVVVDRFPVPLFGYPNNYLFDVGNNILKNILELNVGFLELDSHDFCQLAISLVLDLQKRQVLFAKIVDEQHHRVVELFYHLSLLVVMVGDVPEYQQVLVELGLELL